MSDQTQPNVPPGSPLPGQPPMPQTQPPAPPAPPVNTDLVTADKAVYDPVEGSVERSDKEARMREDGTEVPNFDPSNPDHQKARLEHSNDYLVGDLRELGYEAPVYE